MMNLIFRRLHSLSQQTALLEALDWDDELLGRFQVELQAMLSAAPPSVDKALFWLRNTPWQCFDDELLPENVYKAVEDMIYRQQKIIYNEMKQQKILDEGGWN
tara:strand:+ start:2965 stop:3273 length:309 start_codon:yes stop_codon:yes gene_type:complete